MPQFDYRPLAYTSPKTETRLEFTFDGALSDGETHNLGEFQFAGQDGKYYQDRSITTDDYPFLILLKSQDDLREVRKIFSEKVTQGKPGTLEHPDPTIGTFPVVISSTRVTQNIIKGSGKIEVAVTFLRQIPDLLGGDPVESNNPASANATKGKIDQLNIDQATDAANQVQLDTGAGFAAFVESATQTVLDVKDKLGAIAAKVDEINQLFNETFATIINEMDTLARAPFTLARQIQNLIQLPMLAVDSVTDRIAAFKDYVDETLNLSETELAEITGGTAAGANILTAKSVAALAAISGINYSAVSGVSVNLDQIKSGAALQETGYLSRNQILETIESVQNIALSTTEILSELAANYGATLFFSQYFDYSVLNKSLISSTVRNLNSRIFNAVSENIITTEKGNHPIVLCYELYKSTELSIIEFFLNSNDLHDSEIYWIEKGKEIVYYV